MHSATSFSESYPSTFSLCFPYCIIETIYFAQRTSSVIIAGAQCVSMLMSLVIKCIRLVSPLCLSYRMAPPVVCELPCGGSQSWPISFGRRSAGVCPLAALSRAMKASCRDAEIWGGRLSIWCISVWVVCYGAGSGTACLKEEEVDMSPPLNESAACVRV